MVVGRNAQIYCKRYDVFYIQRVNSTRIKNWYNSTVTDAFLDGVLALMELIFIRDGSFESQEMVLLFILVMKSICLFH